MGPTASTMERLRCETAAEHARLEQATGMMSPHLTVDGYRRYLMEMWAVHAALEPRFAGMEGLAAALPDVDERRKLPFLERDLAALGVTPEALAALARSRPPIPCSGLDEVLGVLYVLEGSTLGGRLIRRHLEALLGPSVAGATSYLDAYGEVGVPWRRFGAAAEAHGTAHPGAPDAMVAAAVATFRALLVGWGEMSGPT